MSGVRSARRPSAISIGVGLLEDAGSIALADWRSSPTFQLGEAEPRDRPYTGSAALVGDAGRERRADRVRHDVVGGEALVDGPVDAGLRGLPEHRHHRDQCQADHQRRGRPRCGAGCGRRSAPPSPRPPRRPCGRTPRSGRSPAGRRAGWSGGADEDAEDAAADPPDRALHLAEQAQTQRRQRPPRGAPCRRRRGGGWRTRRPRHPRATPPWGRCALHGERAGRQPRASPAAPRHTRQRLWTARRPAAVPTGRDRRSRTAP